MRDLNHYASIVAVLLAGDIQARLVGHGKVLSAVEVKTERGDRIIWGNGGEHWAATIVAVEGETSVFTSTLAFDAAPEDVAVTMAHEPVL